MGHINSCEIHLWLALLGDITDPCLLGEYRSLLSEEELRQHARFRFERNRHRYRAKAASLHERSPTSS